jgi:hypothetical protein
MRRFLVCIHDASPAHAHETRLILRDLSPMIGRRLSIGVVPDWHGAWPLAAHREYSRVIADASEQLLLHGYHHRRARGWGPATLLAGRCDEMNGLSAEETLRTLERGQRAFAEVFGAPARGFLAPGWQAGHVRRLAMHDIGLDHILGFFSLEASRGGSVPLATWTWDCGRWTWLGHAGHGLGWTMQAIGRRVPVLAIHPRDLARGFWPKILALTGALLESGYAPATPADLLEAQC